MTEPTADDLRQQLAAAEARAAAAEARAELASAELERVREWRKATLTAVVVVAALAMLMLGIVAFNAVDDERSMGWPDKSTLRLD